MVQVATPTRVEIYGDPGPQVATMVAALGGQIFSSFCGFDRQRLD
jgi:hypothetical protein